MLPGFYPGCGKDKEEKQLVIAQHG